MKTPFTILALWLTALAVAAVSIPLPLVNAKRLSNPATYLLQENFEGTGYDGGTWTETLNGGTVDEDYTTTILHGSQSLLLTDAAAALCSTVSPTWTGANTTFGYFQLRVASLPASSASVLQLRSSGNVRVSVQVMSTGALRIFGNVGGSGTAASTVDAISTGTKIHVWFSVDFNSTPEPVTIGFSTDGVRPTSGNKYASGTSDVTAGGVNELLLQPPAASLDTIVDRVLIDDVQIGDNP